MTRVASELFHQHGTRMTDPQTHCVVDVSQRGTPDKPWRIWVCVIGGIAIEEWAPMETIELELDKDGSPVTFEPAAWYVCFVPGLKKQWWHRFVNERHKHVFAMKPSGPGEWTLLEPWWHRLLTATITSEQARKFLIWGARGDVLHVREFIPGEGSQVRGWMTCAALASYLLGRRYWVWTPHGLYKLLLREPNVCRVDVSKLVKLDAASLANASEIILTCDECKPHAPKHRPGAPKPFCMNCGRDLMEVRSTVETIPQR